MTPDNVIYTDGHDVVVTDSMLKVKKRAYRLSGITKFTLWTIRPDRWPAILLMLIGLLAIACGYMNVLPSDLDVRSEGGTIGANTLALIIGAGLTILALLMLLFTKERYAVRIGTAEGEKNAVVSSRREYIAQIVDAIHSAFDMNRISPVGIAKK